MSSPAGVSGSYIQARDRGGSQRQPPAGSADKKAAAEQLSSVLDTAEVI